MEDNISGVETNYYRLGFDRLSSHYAELGKTPVRLLTFQSKEVLDKILNDKYYECDINKSREQRDYSIDIKQLGGKNPIWCFSPTSFEENQLLRFNKDQFDNGKAFFNYRCEMSLPSGEHLNDLYLLELEVMAENIKVGLTHNAYKKAVVIPNIKLENLIAIYQLNYKDNHKVKWYYPSVRVLDILGKEPLFTENFNCKKINK